MRNDLPVLHVETLEFPAAVVVRDLAFQYAALGPIFEKMKDLPDGTRFTFKIENQEEAQPGGTDNSGAAPRRV